MLANQNLVNELAATYKCDVCGKTFNKKANLRKHSNVHKEEKPFSCDSCGFNFRRKYTLLRHQQRKHNQGQNPYQCNVCDKRFNTPGNLDMHKNVHLRKLSSRLEQKCEKEVSTTTYTCDVCDKVFTQKALLRQHNNVHEDVKHRPSCDLCDLTFSRKDSFLRHQKRIHKRGQKYDVCNKRFNNSGILSRHKNIEHSKELPNKLVKKCDKDESTETNAKQQSSFNERSTEEINKVTPTNDSLIEFPVSYNCDVCDKEFNQKSDLREHSKVHKDEKLYSCDVCHLTFSRKNSFYRHQKRIHNQDESPYQCDVCNKRFNTPDILSRHQIFVHYSKIPSRLDLKSEKEVPAASYKCDVCDQIFTQKAFLIQHKKIHEDKKRVSCELCGLTFCGKYSFLRHLKKIHHQGRKSKKEIPAATYKCDVCDKVFSNKFYLRQHSYVHKGSTRHSCDSCDITFCRIDAFYRHLKKVHNKGQGPYQCNVCNKRFNTPGNLGRHKNIAHLGKLPNRIVHKCDVCGKTFSSRFILLCHQKLHTKLNLHQCEICLKNFTRTSALKNHKIVHTGERLFKCNICPKHFSRIYTLEIHQRLHTGERPFQCDVCGEGFIERSLLTYHSMKHAEKKPHECHECGKGFCKRTELKKHLMTHTDEKPYICDVCGKSFTSQGSVMCHKRIHTGESPYVCDICGRKFNQSSSLKRHQRVHTREKPYACDVCDKHFALLVTLQDHYSMHTGDKPHKCDVCEQQFYRPSSLQAHVLKKHRHHRYNKKVVKQGSPKGVK